MDGRRALAEGTGLTFRNSEGGAVAYVIKGEIGRGGSCIAYDAAYADNLGNAKLVRVKECYPCGLRLERRKDGALTADARDEEAFEARKRRMIDAYRQNHALFSTPALTNAIDNTSDIYLHGGTVYIVSTWSNGETLAARRCESLGECVRLLVSAGKVLQRIHEAGYLYLDLKPENILTLEGSTDLVQLFDFDSMVSLEDLRSNHSVRTSYTKGYAPLELQTGKLQKLGYHSDVYSLGAVLFNALWGRTPSAPDCDAGAAYDFEHMAFSGHYQDRLYRELTGFLRRTLASYPGDRYAAMSEAVAHLERIAGLSDGMQPWLHSTPMDASGYFTGRDGELAALEEMLRLPNRHVFSICGLGGIGKSTLAREYLARRRGDYDAVLFLYDDGNPDGLLADDRAVHINTVEKAPEEPMEDYLPRKLRALQTLCAEQSLLVVLDNFHPDHLENTGAILGLDWKVLLVSREALAEDFCPSLRLDELPIADQARLFTHYAHCDLTEDADIAAFVAMAERVGGHTLMLELIGRQMARNYLSLREAAALTETAGLQSLSGGRVDYVKDRKTIRATVEAILDQLVEISRYTADERRVMKLLSLFDAPGVPALVFRAIANLKDMEAVNDLEDGGWLRVDQNRLSLHPVLREYVQRWPWQGEDLAAAEALMERLYSAILPDGQRPDADKQFPEFYGGLYPLIVLAGQVVNNLGVVTPAAQKLRCRMILDAPVDQYEAMLEGIAALLSDPDYLQPDSVLRLYRQAAMILNKVCRYDEALETLSRMKAYLSGHPSLYYRALYHDSMANVLHDMDAEGNLKQCLRHQNKAIFWARRTRHAASEKLLIQCLLNHAMTLLDVQPDAERCGKTLSEAATRIQQSCGAYDIERYNGLCIAAMFHAKLTHDSAEALHFLEGATRIADVGRDSDMAYADHLLDECAPICCEMGLYGEAVDAILEAMRLCETHREIAVYRRLRFDAGLFLARVYADSGDFVRAEAAYDRLEDCRADSPYSFDETLPLCPEEIRERAREQNDG